MPKTRLSLFYLAGYLIPAGLLLLFAPTFSTRLLLSNGNYGEIFPRLAGMLLIGLGGSVGRREAIYSNWYADRE